MDHDCSNPYNQDPETGECRICRGAQEGEA